MTTAIAALPFFGGTLACFDPSDSTVTESTTGGYFNPTFSTCALSIQGNGTSFATSPTWSSAATFWNHFVFCATEPFRPDGEGDLIHFLNGSTIVAKVTISGSTSCTFTLYTLQSGVMTAVGNTTVPLTIPATPQTFDVKLVGNTSSGSAAMFVAGTAAFPAATGLAHSGWTGVTQIKLWGGMYSGYATIGYWSQVICDTVSTIGRFLRTDRLNTNSAVNTAWTGGVGNINEIPTNDATVIYATATNQFATYYESGLSLSGYSVVARGVGARMRVQGTNPPPKIKLVVRSGATNFASTAIVAASNFQAAFNSWTVNPHTSIAWTATNAAATEQGVASSS